MLVSDLHLRKASTGHCCAYLSPTV
jgi:hypothetical protein